MLTKKQLYELRQQYPHLWRERPFELTDVTVMVHFSRIGTYGGSAMYKATAIRNNHTPGGPEEKVQFSREVSQEYYDAFIDYYNIKDKLLEKIEQESPKEKFLYFFSLEEVIDFSYIAMPDIVTNEGARNYEKRIFLFDRRISMPKDFQKVFYEHVLEERENHINGEIYALTAEQAIERLRQKRAGTWVEPDFSEKKENPYANLSIQQYWNLVDDEIRKLVPDLDVMRPNPYLAGFKDPEYVSFFQQHGNSPAVIAQAILDDMI